MTFSTENIRTLGSSGYRIKSRHTDGPVGSRWVVDLPGSDNEYLADLVLPGGDEYTLGLCLNALRTRRWTDDRSLANVLEAGWLDDGHYFQVLEISARARALEEASLPMAESDALLLGRSLLAGLRHMHRRELVHAALCPRTIYRDGDRLWIGDLWWAHNADGNPLCPELASHYSVAFPEFAQPFAAPEVLLGGAPKRESDIYSFGAVLYFLLTSRPPRDLSVPSHDEEARAALAETIIQSPADLRTDISDETAGLLLKLLERNPSDRPNIFLLEAIFDRLTAGLLPPLTTLGPTNELWLGLKAVKSGAPVKINDLYKAYGNVQVALTDWDSITPEVWFGIQHQFIFNGMTYLMLTYPPGLYEDWEVEPSPVLRVQSPSTLRVLTDEEFDTISGECRTVFEQKPALDIAALTSCLGDIAERE